MASEARALLDEQIAALNALRDAAQWAYRGAGFLQVLAIRGDGEELASYLANLTIERRADLNDCLKRAEHWLGPTNPVYVPIPAAEDDYPSACYGAACFFSALAVLAGDEANTDEHLPTDAVGLARALAEKFQSGIPDWLLWPPVDELERLVDVVRQETDAAIKYHTARFIGIRPAAEADEHADATQPPTERKRRGRRKADYETVQRESQLAAAWEQARISGVYKPDFAKNHGTTAAKLDLLLDRVGQRNRRSDK
ncbi:MAG: hypothetical protein KF688_13080 [Pirellulales bacterium]|nr:hypothetical protein [Pirellulales bacterium]